MAKYIPYVRTEQGYIERSSYAIFNSPGSSSSSCVAPYIHEEQLVGWPESKVYWAAKVGPWVWLPSISVGSHSWSITGRQ
jgi:hypothetical protein